MMALFAARLPKTKGAKVAAGGGVFVQGDREVIAMLSGVEGTIRKQMLRSALKKAAKDIILPEAKARVPVDSGDLEQSLRVRAITRSRKQFGYEVLTGEGFFKGDQFYGGFQEFGTKTMRADPFLRPAGYGNEARIRKLVIDELNGVFKFLSLFIGKKLRKAKRRIGLR